MFVHINEISFDNTQYAISFVNFLRNMISEHKNPNENLLRTLDTWQIFGTRRSYTCLPQCYYRGVHAAYLDAYPVVMLCFKFVYAILCGILRYLLFIVSS